MSRHRTMQSWLSLLLAHGELVNVNAMLCLWFKGWDSAKIDWYNDSTITNWLFWDRNLWFGSVWVTLLLQQIRIHFVKFSLYNLPYWWPDPWTKANWTEKTEQLLIAQIVNWTKLYWSIVISPTKQNEQIADWTKYKWIGSLNNLFNWSVVAQSKTIMNPSNRGEGFNEFLHMWGAQRQCSVGDLAPGRRGWLTFIHQNFMNKPILPAPESCTSRL